MSASVSYRHRILANLYAVAIAVTVTATAACSTYKPDTLHRTHHGAAQTVGCIDVAVETHIDIQAEGPVAEVHVANRCNTAVVVDYQAILASVVYADGSTGQSRVYDPEGTLRPVTLDARSRGWEAFEYHPLDPSDGDRIARSLCLDVRNIDQQQPSSQTHEICVAAK